MTPPMRDGLERVLAARPDEEGHGQGDGGGRQATTPEV
jgi:hypothetical protein